jgi:GT2 family glycosyltransferase
MNTQTDIDRLRSTGIRLDAEGQRPFVSVIIPHYNDVQALSICVASLRDQTWPATSMEIIVADNNSACGLDAVASAARGCRVVHAPIQGAGPARNAGADASRGSILAFIDSDCNPQPDWVENGVRALASYDFVGGRVETSVRNPARPTAVEAWEVVFGFDFERYIHVEGYTGTGNMWVWRRVFGAVGGFRAGVSEDMDWSFRATRAGFRLGYEPSVVVSHAARASWPDLLHRWRRVIAEHRNLSRQKPLSHVRWLARTLAMPLSIGPHLIRILRCQRLPDPRAKAEAAAVLIAHRLWRTYFMARLLFAPTPARRGTGADATSPALEGASVANFLGLPFVSLDMAQAVAAVKRASEGAQWRYVVTPNAAHLARLSQSDRNARPLARSARGAKDRSRAAFEAASDAAQDVAKESERGGAAR